MATRKKTTAPAPVVLTTQAGGSIVQPMQTEPTAATATHAVLSRLGRPIRVAPLADWRAIQDMRSAASMSVGIYSLAEVTAAEADRAQCQVEGLRAAVQVMASPEWRCAV